MPSLVTRLVGPGHQDLVVSCVRCSPLRSPAGPSFGVRRGLVMSTFDPVSNTSPTAARPPLPPLGRIGVTAVERIEEATRAFRALDYQYGGGACHAAVVGSLPWGLRMLGADAAGLVLDRLCVAVADLHNLAGWTSFDTGQAGVARTHFGRALERAEQGHNDALVANSGYRRGRIDRAHNDH